MDRGSFGIERGKFEWIYLFRSSSLRGEVMVIYVATVGNFVLAEATSCFSVANLSDVTVRRGFSEYTDFV